ncbi:DUF305 domain-containing protein [Nannocystis pusilla]|uniref:DUF305 domain-containing protein n=1 Tax=Nannocystis pusilla TaxID=889268 RepID=A0A9X3EIA8_9BACT|nr:DUF305 domain-containing protein [Nannocystis pusilla]MCY1004567.1 DUF305 domain-containing protein [Nannocystis pusilla]
MMQIFRSILSLVALVGVVACDDTQAECAGPRSDVEFIDAMVPHHEMAVEMSNKELADGTDPEVQAMAQGMHDAQLAEIAQMKAVRAELTGSDEVPERHDAQMQQMEADMKKLAAASGAEVDRVFVEEMLPHHAGAITMAHEALPYLEREDMRQLAHKIIRDQAAEIGQLGAMLDE